MPDITLKQPDTVPSLAVIALNRMGFGPTPGDIAAFNALGNTDNARLTAYVDQQLAPYGLDDSAFDAMVAAGGFETLNKSREQLWVEYARDVDGLTSSNTPARELTLQAINRAVYSKRQLLEVMVDFWAQSFQHLWLGVPNSVDDCVLRSAGDSAECARQLSRNVRSCCY